MFEVGRQIEFFMQLGGLRPLGSNDNKKKGVTEPSGLERQTSLELTSKEPEFDKRAISVAKSGTCCCVDTGALGPQHTRR